VAKEALVAESEVEAAVPVQALSIGASVPVEMVSAPSAPEP